MYKYVVFFFIVLAVLLARDVITEIQAENSLPNFEPIHTEIIDGRSATVLQSVAPSKTGTKTTYFLYLDTELRSFAEMNGFPKKVVADIDNNQAIVISQTESLVLQVFLPMTPTVVITKSSVQLNLPIITR